MYGRQPTSLYNLFDRFSRVAKANLNNIAKKLEDPEKIMTQALEDMQGDLVKVRQSYAEVTASVRRLSKEMDVSVKMSGEWRTRAETALRAGEEELAKEALQRRQVAEEKAETLRAQIETQEASLGKLKEGMELLEGKILESKVSRRKGVGEPRELRE
jgi:phage shock protein A